MCHLVEIGSGFCFLDRRFDMVESLFPEIGRGLGFGSWPELRLVKQLGSIRGFGLDFRLGPELGFLFDILIGIGLVPELRSIGHEAGNIDR